MFFFFAAPPTAQPAARQQTASAGSEPKPTSQSPHLQVLKAAIKVLVVKMLSYSAGYFSVQPSEEFWLNPGDFLGFSGTGAAAGIGYR